MIDVPTEEGLFSYVLPISFFSLVSTRKLAFHGEYRLDAYRPLLHDTYLVCTRR